MVEPLVEARALAAAVFGPGPGSACLGRCCERPAASPSRAFLEAAEFVTAAVDSSRKESSLAQMCPQLLKDAHNSSAYD